MALSTSGFVSAYPEFQDCLTDHAAVVTAKLEMAKRFCSARVWGASYEHGVYAKCAHLVSLHPFGESARLNKWSEATTYGQMFKELSASIPIAMLCP